MKAVASRCSPNIDVSLLICELAAKSNFAANKGQNKAITKSGDPRAQGSKDPYDAIVTLSPSHTPFMG